MGKLKIKKEWTRNEAIEMMHQNTANAFRQIAHWAKRNNRDADEIIEFMIETADTLEAQALTVSLRDELGYNLPVGD